MGPNKKGKIPWECYSPSGDIVSDPDAILEKWKQDFCSLYAPPVNITDNQRLFKESIKLENDKFECTDTSDQDSPLLNASFSNAEISKAIYKSKKHKAPGLDGIIYDILKNQPSVEILTQLFNLCFENHKVPKAWLQALIHPIPKSSTNDPRIPLNYRGISLLSVVSKLYTATLNTRLNKFAEQHKLFVNEQNGFREGRSCLDHIFVLQNTLRIRNQLNTHTYCAFIDFKKAFDFVDRDFLLHKLIKNGITGNFYNVVKSIVC